MGKCDLNKHESFNLNNYDCIGFDLDNTLVEYDAINLASLVYDILVRYLVREKSYHENLLKGSIDFNFLQKGLFLDIVRGNVVKLGVGGVVLEAYHGTRRINDISIEYGSDSVWDLAAKYENDPFLAWNGDMSEQIRCLLDNFDVCVSYLFAKAMDLSEDNNGPSIWRDIHQGLCYMYDSLRFSKNIGEFFPALRQNPDHFIKSMSKQVIENIVSLRKEKNKFIVLLTGSACDFASLTSTTAIGTDWKKLFDCIVYSTKKPGFFSLDRQFLDIHTLETCNFNDDTFEVSQGNWTQLKDSIGRRIHKPQFRSLYVGDNMLQDVYAPVKFGFGDSVCVTGEAPFIKSPVWGSFYEGADGKPSFWKNFLLKYSKFCVNSINEFPFSS